MAAASSAIRRTPIRSSLLLCRRTVRRFGKVGAARVGGSTCCHPCPRVELTMTHWEFSLCRDQERSAFLFHKEREEFRRFSLARVAPDDVYIVRALVEGLPRLQSRFLP